MEMGRWFAPRPVYSNCVYEWNSWRGWYVSAILPDALRLRAQARDRAEDIAERIPDSVRRVLFHLDLTNTETFPLERVSLMRILQRREIQVHNAVPTDLSKSLLHRICAGLGLPNAEALREGLADELLIAKTDANYGGRSERLLGTLSKSCPIRNALDYRVMRREEIPSAWWTNPSLTIERFIRNREDRIHRVRVSLDRRIYTSGTSPKPVKKLSDCTNLEATFGTKAEPPANVPPALVDTAEKLLCAYGLDFGALDLIADDEGRFYCIDVNTTPGMGKPIRAWVDFLREPWLT